MVTIEETRTRRPERHESILKAACAEFAQLGFERGNIEAIAHRAGVAKGTVYNYFISKEELFLRTIEFAATELIDRMQSSISPSDPPEERMRQFVLADLTFMDEHRDTYMLMISLFYGANFLYGQGSSFLRIAIAAYGQFFSMLGEICSDWMGAEVIEERGADTLGFQILGLVEGANLRRWADRGKSPDREQDAARIMAMLQHGLGPVSPRQSSNSK